jgi:alpha-mannosidase
MPIFRNVLNLFSTLMLQIGKIIETSLSANQERASMEKKRLKWKVQGPPPKEDMVRGGSVDPSKLIVELAPMEIRTFIISFDHGFTEHVM